MVEMALDQAEEAKLAGSLSPKLTWELANPKWAATLNPLLANHLFGGNLLTNITLKAGNNTINHGLGEVLQGYFVVLNSAASTFYDNQRTNQRPDLTLILNSSGPTTISIYVF